MGFLKWLAFNLFDLKLAFVINSKASIKTIG